MVSYKMGKFGHKNKCGISCADEDRDQGDVSTRNVKDYQQTRKLQQVGEARDRLSLMALEEANPAAV